MINADGDLIERDPNDFKIGYRKIQKKNEVENFVGAWFSFPKGKKVEAEEKYKEIISLIGKALNH